MKNIINTITNILPSTTVWLDSNKGGWEFTIDHENNSTNPMFVSGDTPIASWKICGTKKIALIRLMATCGNTIALAEIIKNMDMSFARGEA